MNKSKTKSRRKKICVFLAFAVTAVFICGAAAFTPQIQKFFYPVKYREYVEKYAAMNGLDKYFVYAVIKTESDFDPDAESDVGAKGLMQLMEDSYDWVKYRMGTDDMSAYSDICDPELNIKYGTFLLRLLYEEYDSMETAAAAYHTGRGNVNKWLSDSRYSSDGKTLCDMPSSVTRHYVRKVMKAYDKYNSLYN